ncbi:hypothetical protein [Methanofollis ethanolicus]|uniref:hypothetical protein n=1 Tax=Methanofollis ethanolicus TaxID=488124 RepID=UPI000834F58F|nr:hypothetical protein [Methanofollis ethanolicus]
MTSMIVALKGEILARIDETRWKIAAGFDAEEELAALTEEVTRLCDETDALYCDAMWGMW